MQQFRYRLATVDDVAVITDIYNEAVMAGGSTADTVPVTYEARRRWIESHVDPYAVFVFETIAGDGEAEEVGFGAISVFYDRPGYALSTAAGMVGVTAGAAAPAAFTAKCGVTSLPPLTIAAAARSMITGVI